MVHTLWNCPAPFNLLSDTNWQRYESNVPYIIFSIFRNVPYIIFSIFPFLSSQTQSSTYTIIVTPQ
uniref:Uncharacterized protein n=1 Tax=Arundo donax TaxID=35708 RepID=A0A0A9H2G5_ARUDO